MLKYEKFNGENFQGKRNSKYFEGWYYKLVSKDKKSVYSFIPGISYPDNNEKAHSFIQIINGSNGKTNYVEYSADSFTPIDDSLSITIDSNKFSKHGIKLDINDENISANGVVYFNDMIQIVKSVFSPGAMGFFGYFPFMECFHEVISMNHLLSGNLEINNKEINFDGGKGYIEKDWGASFPKKYIWIQSNHFSDESVSLMCSIAEIPFLFCTFTGFICILNIRGMEYRFATYNNSKISNLIILEKEVCVSLKNSKYTLQITADKNSGGFLQAPLQGNMTRRITESINSNIDIKLRNKDGATIYKDTGDITGLEIVNYQ